MPDLPAAARQGGRPRLVLTYDQVLDRNPFWSMGANPFSWAPRSEADDLERAAKFRAELEASDPDQPWDLVRDTLLEE